MYNELKTAQAAAYLIAREGGRMYHLKLMKLLYLSDRRSLEKYNNSISGDTYYSMKNGPVLSYTLDLINGDHRYNSLWKSWITDKEDHQVGTTFVLSGEESLDQLEELSDNDLSILDEIYRQYGHYDRWALVDLTHDPDIIPEWSSPDHSCKPIDIRTLLTHLGKNEETIKFYLEREELEREVSGIIARNQ